MGLLGICAFGFVFAAVLPTARTAVAVATAVYLPMIFLSGALWPREALPDWAARVGDALPLTYVVEAIRDPWTGAGWNAAALAVLAALLAVGVAVSSRTFRWE